MKQMACQTRYSHPTRMAALLLLVLLVAALPAAASGIDDDHLEAYFKAKFGYDDVGEYQFKPTMLNYVCFSHYISRDFGILNDDRYVLYGGVTEQDASDYIAYLNRFGYTVAFDSVQGDTRYVELRDINAPAYLPQVYRFYYYPAEEAIVTVEPQRMEDAFEAARTLHWKSFEDDRGYAIKLLQPGLSAVLKSTRAVNEYLWADASHPFCRYAFQGLNEKWLGPQRLEKAAEDGTRMVVMNDQYADANGNRMSFWLLQVEITTDGQPFTPDDWEFCIASDDLCVYYPYQIGNRLTESEAGPVLSMEPELFPGNTHTVWLSFPAYANNPALTSRLYISRAGEGTPIMDRTCFGFNKPEELDKGVQWDSWDFTPNNSQP